MPPRYWDVSTREKALGAYMEMFKIEDEQWNSFCGGEEVEPRLKSTYRAAKAGDARAAYLLFNDLRPPGTFGSFSLELIETVVYEAPPTLPSEDLTEPEPPPPEVLLKDAFLTAKWESVEIGGAIKELTETLSSIALWGGGDPQNTMPSQVQRYVWGMEKALRRCTKAYRGLQRAYGIYKANKPEDER